MKITYTVFTLVFTILVSNVVKADSKFKPIEVRFLGEDSTSPTAKIEALSWAEGHWKSQRKKGGFSGGGEHVILAAHDGQMPGLVRVFNKDNTNMMYELSSFLEVDGTLTYRNRHFATDLVAWQEPEIYVDRRLVAIEGNTAYFHGITFVNRGPNKMGVSFVLTDDDGKQTQYNVDYINASLK